MARPQIAMTAAEVGEFLAGKRFGVVGTRDATGAPDGEPATLRWADERLVFAVATGGPTARNVAVDSRVVVSVEEFPAYARIKGVAVHGRAVADGEEGGVIRFRIEAPRIESFDFSKGARSPEG